MTYIKYIFFTCLALLLAFFSVEFITANTRLITVKLLGLSSPELTLGLWLIIALVVGALLGFLVNMGMVFSTKLKMLRLYRDLHRIEKELAKLKSKSGSISSYETEKLL